MKKIFILTLIILSSTIHAKTAELKYPFSFLIEYVLSKKNISQDPKIPIPTLHFESKTKLKDFQDAMEKQWGFRPKQFSNAFAIESNQIFITDDAAYYIKHGRCMDDSVVHEIVHYYQTKYRGWDINDESLEWDAIDVQSEFRATYCPLP